MVRIVAQYLQDEGFNTAAMTLLDEASVKRQQVARTRSLLGQMKKAVVGESFRNPLHLTLTRRGYVEGNWEEVDALCAKHMFRNKKSFLYAVAKQQYLELLERSEAQGAFDFLTRRLKPLEDVASSPDEFRDLAYVLTCRSVQVRACLLAAGPC
jgi:hypothetical protein